MSKLIIIETAKDLIAYRKHFNFKSTKPNIGFVPTMGALHSGHESLMQKAASENELSIASIFINPTQFNNADDLAKYPKTFEQDLKILESAGINILYYPKYDDIYPDHYRYKVTENSFSKKLCGAHRPGHFDGVLTVVLKLLNISGATKAYFGLKDYQQYKLIAEMAQALFLNCEIIGCPTIREENGLAKSSRNTRLSKEALIKSSLIYKTISLPLTTEEAKSQLVSNGFEIDYLEDHDNRRFVAATIEGVRLIDNVSI